MNRYLLTRLSALFWIALVLGLLVNGVSAYTYSTEFETSGGLIPTGDVIGLKVSP